MVMRGGRYLPEMIGGSEQLLASGATSYRNIPNVGRFAVEVAMRYEWRAFATMSHEHFRFVNQPVVDLQSQRKERGAVVAVIEDAHVADLSGLDICDILSVRLERVETGG